MRFAHPELLLALPVLVIVAWLLHRASCRSARRKLLLFGPESRLGAILRTLDPGARRRKAICFAIGLGLLVVALARPLSGPDRQAADQSGAEFYLVLDVSNSMLVRDVEPDRLEAIKRSLDAWIKKRHGDRIGLILVAGDAFVQAPLTSDYTALREVLRQSDPSALSLGGTNLPAAIATAAKALKDSRQENKIVIIISDGDNLEGDPSATVRQARLELNGKIFFHAIGVGTAAGGQVPRFNKREVIDYAKPPRDFVQDEYRMRVHSRLDERSLRNLASAGGGRYYAFDGGDDFWDVLHAQIIQPLAKKTDTLDYRHYTELFQIPLLVSLLILLWESGLSNRLKNPPAPRPVVTLPERGKTPAAVSIDARGGRPKPAALSSRSKVLLGLLLAVGLCDGVGGLRAETPSIAIQEAGRLMSAGRSAEAAEVLRAVAQKHPGDMLVLYNYAVAAYISGRYVEASQAFAEVAGSSDEKLSSLALTQLGNAQFRLGQNLRETHNVEGALVAWERAVDYYRNAIDEKSLRDTRHNLEVTSSRLETLLLEVAERRIKESAETDKPATREALLAYAMEKLGKAAELSPRNASIAGRLEEVRRLYARTVTELARDHRRQSEAARVEAKAAAAEGRDKDGRIAARKAQSERVAAMENYEKALDALPDAALAAEYAAYKKELADAVLDEAAETLSTLNDVQGANRLEELNAAQKVLNQALARIDTALGLDEHNERGRQMQSESLSKLEAVHLAEADFQKTKADQVALKSQAGALGLYAAALENYQTVLRINPDNAQAQAGRIEAEKGLAASYAAAGKAEMEKAEAMASGDAPAPQPADAGRLQQQIGHLEKASQSFAQAEFLAAGATDAASLAAWADEQLQALRNQLDGALAQGATPGGAEPPPAAQPGESPGEDAGPADAAAPAAASASPAAAAGGDVPVLGFSQARVSSELEGQFRDKSKREKIRDW